MKVDFRITENQLNVLQSHLHSGDGLEAIAFGLCGRLNTEEKNILLLHEIYLVPHEQCERDVDYVKWNTNEIEHILTKACENDFGIVKFHSHFLINSDFSELDDISDVKFFESVYAWNDTDLPHASLIMYPDNTFRGRVVNTELNFERLNSITIIGENVTKFNFFESEKEDDVFNESMDRNKQAFGEKTVGILKGLKIGVVGCSGTGSPTIEQLVRLGVGELVLVDPDKGELANMNRIIGMAVNDVELNTLKVDAIKNHIQNIGLNTIVQTFPYLLQNSQEAVNALASCDLIFGCVDSAEGRHYLNLIGHYYLVPIIDIGVKLSADGLGGIESINGNIHYVYPGSESLLERKVYSSEKLVEDELKRTSPDEYQKRKVYFDNIEVVSPAVISINTLHSSLAVCEMLDRLHPFRFSSSNKFGTTHINLSDWDISHYEIGKSKSRFFSEDTLGIGDKQPKIIRHHEKVN
jgi:molybdopterin/thiamine biosynthesis adenylyltransferase